MRDARGQKADLFKWVNDQQQLDIRTKFILKELAAYADPACCAWSKVETLAYAASCSARTVQNHLALLKEEGLIVDTGRLHRLDDSTRSVPIYQLAPKIEGLGRRISMGEISAPIPAHGCNPDRGMGEEGLHPHKENTGEQEAIASSGREREAQFLALEDAVPPATLKFTDRDAAFAAFVVVVEAGIDPAELVGCARRMAEDPAYRSRKFPPPLETWLAKGQFRGWLVQPQLALAAKPEAVSASAAPQGDQAIWQAVLVEVRLTTDPGEFGSYVAPAYLAEVEGSLLMVARTGVARDWIAGKCWRRIEAAWAKADGAGRKLRLVSKSEFEALAARQHEGA